MASSNFSIENILSAAKSFSPSTTAMMLNAQQAFMALNSFPTTIPNPIDFFNPYAFPATTSQNVAFAASQFPFWLAAGFPQHPYLGHPYSSPFCPSVINGKRKRRHRTIFSEHQLQILEKTFNTITQYPDVQLRDRLAAECQLKEERVEVWFKNRRAKDRKKNPEDKKSSNKAGSGASGDGSSPANSLHSDDEEDLDLSDASDSEPQHQDLQVSPSRPQKRKRLNSHSEANELKCAKIEVKENTPTATVNVKLTPKKSSSIVKVETKPSLLSSL